MSPPLPTGKKEGKKHLQTRQHGHLVSCFRFPNKNIIISLPIVQITKGICEYPPPPLVPPTLYPVTSHCPVSGGGRLRGNSKREPDEMSLPTWVLFLPSGGRIPNGNQMKHRFPCQSSSFHVRNGE